jgi:hypothetical protein
MSANISTGSAELGEQKNHGKNITRIT